MVGAFDSPFEQIERTANASGGIVGTWLYTEILYDDGKTYVMQNRQSSLDVKPNGKYSQNIWFGSSLQGHEGTYTVRGSRLTLDWAGKKEIYTMTFGADGNTVTLKTAKGGGWKLERAKK